MRVPAIAPTPPPGCLPTRCIDVELPWRLEALQLSHFNQLSSPLTGDLDVELPWRLEALLASVDMTHAETTRPEDRPRLMAEVKRTVGMKRAHDMLRR